MDSSDPSGLDFIAVGGRKAAGGPFGHLSIEYWPTDQKVKVGKELSKEDMDCLMAQAENAGKKIITASVELSVHAKKWMAWSWTLKPLGFASTRRTWTVEP